MYIKYSDGLELTIEQFYKKQQISHHLGTASDLRTSSLLVSLFSNNTFVGCKECLFIAQFFYLMKKNNRQNQGFA